MDLKNVPVSRCLDRRLRLLGFEVLDLVTIFIVLSVLHLIFGESNLKIPLAWGPTLVLAGILHFGKRGKPENHLLHWARFQVRPGTYSAFASPTVSTPPRTLKHEVIRG